MFIFCYIASKFNSLTVLNLSHIEFLVFVMNRLGAAINQLDSERAEKEAEVQKVMEELESEKAQKEAEVQQVTQENVKVMEENVRLRAMLDKEALLQAMSEQCKFMALNHHN